MWNGGVVIFYGANTSLPLITQKDKHRELLLFDSHRRKNENQQKETTKYNYTHRGGTVQASPSYIYFAQTVIYTKLLTRFKFYMM